MSKLKLLGLVLFTLSFLFCGYFTYSIFQNGGFSPHFFVSLACFAWTTAYGVAFALDEEV
jgi:membrane associated rhomboid family serine protease